MFKKASIERQWPKSYKYGQKSNMLQKGATLFPILGPEPQSKDLLRGSDLRREPILWTSWSAFSIWIVISLYNYKTYIEGNAV